LYIYELEATLQTDKHEKEKSTTKDDDSYRWTEKFRQLLLNRCII